MWTTPRGTRAPTTLAAVALLATAMMLALTQPRLNALDEFAVESAPHASADEAGVAAAMPGAMDSREADLFDGDDAQLAGNAAPAAADASMAGLLFPALLLSLMLAFALGRRARQPASALSGSSCESQQGIDEITRVLHERAEAAERLSALTLATVSHDLRQPMHALRLFIAELGTHPLDARARDIVARADSAALAMNRMLDSVFALSRLDAGAAPASLSVFALQPVLERVGASQHAAADQAGLRLCVRPSAHWVRSDPALLERMLHNLLANAVTHGDADTVVLACRVRGTQLRIEIRDDGRGIANEAQARIFEDFVRLDVSAHPGLGLGLPLVQRLAALLGHRLSLRSAPGRGTVFALDVPLAPPALARASERIDDPLSGLRIVLCDQDRGRREALCALLKSWGCALASAADAKALGTLIDALESRPQVLIADLPPESSLDDLHALRALLARLPDLHAVVLSTDHSREAEAMAQDAAIHLLRKPVRPARLRALLQRLALAAEHGLQAVANAHCNDPSGTMQASFSTRREHFDVRQERSRPAGIRTRNVEQHGFLASWHGHADPGRR